MAEVTMTFNGESRAYLRVLTDLTRTAWAPVSRELLKVPGAAGAYLTGTRTEVRELTVPVIIKGTDYADLQTVKEDLAAWLVHKEAKELTFSDEPNRTYYAVVTDSFEPEEIVKHGKGTIKFLCPDPYKYGDVQTLNWPKQDVLQADFAGKVAGSTVENPHLIKRTSGGYTPNISTELLSVSHSNWIDSAQSQINQAQKLDGTTFSLPNSGYRNISQHLFSFNLIALIERKYGITVPGTSTTEQVDWLKANITKITANWWGKGTNKQADNVGTANFTGKVAGSTVENPHVIKTTGSSTLIAPSNFANEWSGTGYGLVSALDGDAGSSTTSASTNIAMQLYSFNLIEYVQRKYNTTVPGANKAEKVQWLKDNVTFVYSWYGYGSGPAGNKATTSFWDNGGSQWDHYGATSHTSSSITKLSRGSGSDISVLSRLIDNEGFVHVLAHAEASDGTTASAINTDYVELEVTLKPGEDKATLSRWIGSSSKWYGNASRTSDEIGKLSMTLWPAEQGDDGFAHVLVYAEPSNGISPSVIETDYVELNVEIPGYLDPITIDNGGSAETAPTINLEVREPITFALAQKGVEEYQLIGEPVSVEETPVDTRTLLVDEDGSTLSSWAPVVPGMGTHEGTIDYDGSGMVATDYGSGSSYHGPYVYTEVPLTGDFEVELRGELQSGISNTGRFGFSLHDDQMRQIGMMNAADIVTTVHRKSAEGRVGPFVGQNINYPISARNYMHDWTDFPAYLRLKRVGDTFEFYVARVQQDGTHTNALTQTWTTADDAHRGQLKYVSIYIDKYGATPSPQTNRIDYVKVWALGQTTVDQTPYIAYPGDIITFDNAGRRILINGFNRTDLKNFGARYYKLDPGTNVLTLYPSSAFNATITYRERFK